jgi:ubiquinone/menaquinone biosynthesis C-methylase UbiE
MNEYDYDRFMTPFEKLGFRRWRAELVARARPPVLEIGIGTGASLRWYTGDGSIPVVGIDRKARLLRAAQGRSVSSKRRLAAVQMDGLHLGFAENIFASVVTSLVFCSLPDPVRGLEEIRRVLRPKGLLYMMEHVRPDNPLLGRLADWLNVPWNLCSDGCQLNRRTLDAVIAAGYKVESVESHAAGVLQLIVARP